MEYKLRKDDLSHKYSNTYRGNIRLHDFFNFPEMNCFLNKNLSNSPFLPKAFILQQKQGPKF